MSPYIALVLLGALTVVQATLMPAVGLGATKPLLPVLAVVSWGILRGPLAGLGWALALGVFMDVQSPTPLGTYTLPMLAVAGVVAIGHGRLYPTNLLLPGVMAVTATVVFTLVQLAPLALANQLVFWAPGALGSLLLKAVVLSLLWLPLVYFPLRLLARWTGEPRIDWER